MHNFDYENFPDNIDAFKTYIKEKATKYIVYIKKSKSEKFLEEKTLYKNYQLIQKEEFTFENRSFEAYLWKLK